MDIDNRTTQQLQEENTALRQRLASLEAANYDMRQSLEGRQPDTPYLLTLVRHYLLHSLDIIALLDAEGIVAYYSPSLERILGYRPQDAIGRRVFGALHPEDIPHVKAAMAGLIDQKGVSRTVEYRARHRDGSWRSFESVCVGIRDEQGVDRIIISARDITNRKQAEEALRESEERFRNLIEHSVQGIMIHRDFKPLFVNQAFAEIFAYESPDAIRTMGNVIEGLAAPHEQTWLMDYAKARRQGAPVPTHLEFQGMRADGSTVWVGSRLDVIQWDGAPAMQLIAMDITERKRAEEERTRLELQLRQAQKMEAIGTLAGGIAHDFNNILAAILGYTELAMYDLPETSVPLQNLREVLKAGQRAKGLVQQILTFSRQTGQTRSSVQLYLLVKEILSLLRASLPATIEIRHELHADSGMILADITQMHQVVMNLCTNAEYAMRGRSGILNIHVEGIEVDAAFASQHPPLRAGPYVRLTVQDTGHGMDAATLSRIFEPFYTTKGAGEGTGMGLAVVHGIVASHGGAITVESTPGVGTTFAVYLPRIAEAMGVTIFTEDQPLAGGNERVLFVDDEAPLAQLGHDMLDRLGYGVEICTSSTEALERFQATPDSFDLVITDQTMPKMSGELLTKALRRIRPDIPIILCTGFSHVVDALKAREIGIDAFLLKPLVIRDLAQTIRQVLDKAETPPDTPETHSRA
jgi:PAS domain S-box-containing protein